MALADVKVIMEEAMLLYSIFPSPFFSPTDFSEFDLLQQEHANVVNGEGEASAFFEGQLLIEYYDTAH